jgi:small-conductance mechanosensitive channel
MHHPVPWFGNSTVELSIVLETLALLVGASVVILLLNRMMRSWLHPTGTRMGLRSDTIVSFARIITFLFWVVALLLILEMWGVSVGGMWTVLASTAALIGVGFLATWAIISNVTASVFLAVWRPFHLGDTVALLPENLKGNAIERNLMFTVLREESGSVLYIPNNLFFQKTFRVGNG